MVLASCHLMAQEATMKVRCRETVGVGQPFQITFEVNGAASNFKVPSFKNLTFVGGPSQGHSSSVSIINGNVTSSETYTFTIYVQGDKEGTANVGAASCTVDGKTVTSKPFSVKIDKSAPSGNTQRQQSSNYWGWGQPQPAQQQPQQPQPSKTIDNNTLFARASINKTNLYQGEEAIIVYKIYTQVPLTQFQIEKLPRNKGFWSEDLSENMTHVKQYSETFNGRQYQVAEIRRGALFPQESGKLNIAPLQTDVVAIIQTQMQRQRTGTLLDFFIDDPFFTPSMQQAVVKSLTSNSINVNVKPLPEAPEGFCGAVGKFSVSAKSDLTELKANEALTYSVTVKGRGNLSLIEAPQINFPQGLEVYEPRIVDNINKGDNGISGSRTFEWIVTPQTQGEYDIPAFDYIYFDPAAGRYVTEHCNGIHLKVAKGKFNSTAQSDVKELNSDIHHIKSNVPLHPAGSSIHPTLWFWLLLMLPVLVAVVVILLARRQQKIAGNETSMKLQRSMKLAKKRLRLAERHLNDGNDTLFYEEIYKALWGCIADKFDIKLSLLSSETVSRHLAEKNAEPELQSNILQTLKDVDFARFAPGDSGTTKKKIYDEAMNTIMQIGSIKIRQSKNNSSSALGGTLIVLALMLVLPFGKAFCAPSSQQLALEANHAYDSGDYARAVELYNTLCQDGWESWQLYYNLGNAHYRQGEMGQCILYYERALQLDPMNSEIKDNLRLARSKTVDKIEEIQPIFLVQWFNSILSLATPRGWRTITIIILSLLCITACFFFISTNFKTRKRTFLFAIPLFLLLILSIVNATFSARNVTIKNHAVVTAPLVVVKGSPDPNSVDKFVLHEGTKLKIKEQQGEWWLVEIADGKSGWLLNGAEKI